MLDIQRTAGNRAANVYVQRRRPAVVARVPAPTAIVHENRQVSPDFQQTVALLDRLIAEQGWKATSAWAYRFINADPLGDLKYGGDLDLVGRCRQRLRTEIKQREAIVQDLTGPLGQDLGDVVFAGGRFVTTGNAVTKELLNNSERQLKGEAAKYGLKVDGYVWKDYSMAGGPAQDGLRAAAKRLAAQRRNADGLSKTFFKAQQAAETEGRKWGPFIGAGPEFLKPQEDARKAWVAAEDGYHAACVKEQIDYPVLAAYSTVDGAAGKLDELASKSSASLAASLYKTIDERMKNIETVRSEIGDRFNPWKHAQIVALTKQQLGLPPWEARVVDEKAAAVRSGEGKEDEKVWAAVAIGLGLLGAIPTGGSSLLAGVAAAGAAVGAAYSLNSLYEHYKDYSLASAETGTALDKAQAISQDEPGLMWLAFDLLEVGLNVVGAMAAFKAVSGAMAAAEKGGAKGLKALIDTTERAGLGMAGKSRVVAATVERMGGARAVDEMLAAVKETLDAAKPAKGKEALLESVKAAAAKLMKRGQVGVFRPGGKGASLNELERLLKASGEVEPEVTNEARRLWEVFDKGGYEGMYFERHDIILLREGEDMTSMLTHELAHRAQHIERQAISLGTLKSEYQAYHMQREILLMLPEEVAAASPHAWLRTATDQAILDFVLTEPEYAAMVKADAAWRPSLGSLDDPAGAAQAIEEWFVKGSAAK